MKNQRAERAFASAQRGWSRPRPTESGVILKRETAPLRGIWKGKLTEKEIDEDIKYKISLITNDSEIIKSGEIETIRQ